MGEERIGIVGGGEVGVEAFEAQTGQVAQPANDGHGFVWRCAVTRHARVDLDLHVAYLANGVSRGGNALGAAPVGQGWGQVLRDNVGELVGVEAAQ